MYFLRKFILYTLFICLNQNNAFCLDSSEEIVYKQNSELTISNISVFTKHLTDNEYSEIIGPDLQDIKSFLKSREGNFLFLDDITEDIANLKGRYGHVDFIVDSEGDGLCKLKFYIEKKLPIDSVDFQCPSEIMNKIAIDIREGDLVNNTTCQEFVKSILSQLSSMGYLNASVTYEILERDNKVGLVIKIVPGEISVVNKVLFLGDISQSDYNLLKRSLVGITGNKLFSPGIKTAVGPYYISLNVEILKNFFLQKGYPDVVVSYDLDNVNHVLTYNIDKGKKYIIRNIEIKGNKTVSDEVLFKSVESFLSNLEEDGVPFSEGVINRIIGKIQEVYGASGMIDTNVSYKITNINQTNVDIVFNVVESDIFTIGQLFIEGNYSVSASLILDDFNIYPGDVINLKKINECKKRAMLRNLFKEIDIVFVDQQNEKCIKNVIIKVVEGKFTQGKLGASVASSGITWNLSANMMNAPSIQDFVKYLFQYDDNIDPFLKGSGVALDIELVLKGLKPKEMTLSVNAYKERIGRTNISVFSTIDLGKSANADVFDMASAGGEVGCGYVFNNLNASIIASSGVRKNIIDPMGMLSFNGIDFFDYTHEIGKDPSSGFPIFDSIYRMDPDHKIRHVIGLFNVKLRHRYGNIETSFKYDFGHKHVYNVSSLRLLMQSSFVRRYIDIRLGCEAINVVSLEHDSIDARRIPICDQIIIGSVSPVIRFRGIITGHVLKSNIDDHKFSFPSSAANIYTELVIFPFAQIKPVVFTDILITSRRPWFRDVSFDIENKDNKNKSFLISCGIVLEIDGLGGGKYPVQFGIANVLNPFSESDKDNMVMSFAMSF